MFLHFIMQNGTDFIKHAALVVLSIYLQIKQQLPLNFYMIMIGLMYHSTSKCLDYSLH